MTRLAELVPAKDGSCYKLGGSGGALVVEVALGCFVVAELWLASFPRAPYGLGQPYELTIESAGLCGRCLNMPSSGGHADAGGGSIQRCRSRRSGDYSGGILLL